LHRLPGHNLGTFWIRFDMTMTATQITEQAKIDLNRLDIFTLQVLANGLANGLTKVIHKVSNS